MKKITLILGYLAAICLIIFPFCLTKGSFCTASWLLVIAAVLFSLGYAPLLFIQRQKTADTSWKKVANVLILITMIMAGVTVLAQHFLCPVAMGLGCVTYSLIILVIIMQIWKAVKATDPKCSLNNHNISVVAIMVLVLFAFMQATTVPRKVMNEFLGVYYTQQQEIGYFADKAASFMEKFDTKTTDNIKAVEYYTKAKEVTTLADSLVAYLHSLGGEMIQLADKKTVSLDSIEGICHKADRKSVEEVMFTQKKDSILNQKIMAFTTLIDENTSSRGKEMLKALFPECQKDSLESGKDCKSDCSTSCSGCCCCGPSTLIAQLVRFNSLELHIRMLQSETLPHLQALQYRELTRAAAKEDKKDEDTE